LLTVKIGIIGIVLLTAMVKCGNGRFDQPPIPVGYHSIAESKNNHVFLNEYLPQSPYLEIEGRKYKIKEAWVEHPHKGSDGSISESGHAFVMTFEPHIGGDLNFKAYTRDLGWGSNEIWFTFSKEIYDKDTLELLYKESLRDSVQKSFKLFKRR
jgi:hypothetical protein